MIIKTFDFSVCENIYNIKNGTRQLHICDFHNIINKKILVNTKTFNSKFNERKIKYEQREFIFDFTPLENRL
jgi:hypothetical protein